MATGIIHDFRTLQFKASTRLVFFHLREQGHMNEDGRAACAPRVLADELDYSEKVVRNALRELEAAGFIKTETRSRRFTMVSFPQASNRREGAEKGAEKGATNYAKIQRDSANEGAEKGAEKGATGVTAVRRSSGVDVVVHALNESVRETARATPLLVDKFKNRSTAKARYEAALERAPDLPTVTMHIDRLYADLSEGHKYPWAGNPAAATQLADLIFSHSAPLVIAAAEKFFIRGHQWTEERAWAIDEFSRQFAKLIAMSGTTKRALQIRIELKDQTRPSTPRELQAQLVAMRRRETMPEPTDEDRAHARKVVEEYRERHRRTVPA